MFLNYVACTWKGTYCNRSTDELVPVVGQKTFDYLNLIPGLSDPSKIGSHSARRTRAGSCEYPWLLLGFNESLSSFPKAYWQKSPSHTNLVESTHVASNRATTINLLPVESVRKTPVDIDFFHNFDFTFLPVPVTAYSSLAAQRTTSPVTPSPASTPPPPDRPVPPPIVVSSPASVPPTPSVSELAPAPKSVAWRLTQQTSLMSRDRGKCGFFDSVTSAVTVLGGAGGQDRR
ncbi:hypothetical protein B0H19DRAFT_1074336 [Mycena capillaripes]|nr:hypothetical protein B0H19DRAFT_1074336 [Mycena capillaripes]